MASSNPKRHRRSYTDESSGPGDVEADVVSKEEDPEPLSKRQKSNDSLNPAGRPASTIPFSVDMHQPNLFELQIEEMLREVRPHYAQIMDPVDTALRKLKTLIESIEEREPLSVRRIAILLAFHRADEGNRLLMRQRLCTKSTKLRSPFHIQSQTRKQLIEWFTHDLLISISLVATRSRQ